MLKITFLAQNPTGLAPEFTGGILLHCLTCTGCAGRPVRSWKLATKSCCCGWSSKIPEGFGRSFGTMRAINPAIQDRPQ